MRIISTLIVALLVFASCKSENPQDENGKYYDLRNNAAGIISPKSPKNISVHSFTNGAQALNYTDCLLSAWKLVQLDSSNRGGNLSQDLSFCGDNYNALLLERKLLPPYPQLDSSSFINRASKRLGHLREKMKDPKQLICEKFKSADIIMFNEAHDRPQTRAFVLSLLEDLRKAGAVNLAMETFSEKVPQNYLDVKTGWYTCEPVMGQLVREAIRLGYKLIPYEETELQRMQVLNERKDTSENPANRREYFQAVNLYNAIKKDHGISKTVLLGGYGHIGEYWLDATKPFISMAMRFKEISGIDPLTVDQITLLEDNNNNPWAGRLLEKLYAIDSSKAISADTSLWRINLDKFYEIFILHPKTNYIHHRPNWLLTENKQFTGIEIPKDLKPVLVQAYLKDEVSDPEDYGTKIPYDMSFSSEGNKVWMALEKGKAYEIVFRNQENAVIHKMPLDIPK